MPYAEYKTPQTRRDYLDELIHQSRSLAAHALELTKQPSDKPYDLEVVLSIGELLKASLDGLKTLNSK